ncbi:MAG: hypothetical protein RLZZ568_1705, partial [Cyanobacteriota bacterium]
APLEQMAGDPQYNSDIFALGIVGIMALTGIKDPLRIPKDPRTYEFMWQEQVRSPVSLQFIEVLGKMVLCDFRSRYQTVVEVLNDLDRIAPSEATVPATVQEKRGYSTAYDETVALAEAAVPETVQLNEGHNKNTIRKNSQGRSNAATPKWMLYLPLGLGLGVLGGVLGLALIAVWLEPPSPDQSIPLDTYRYRSARIDDAGNIASFAESAQVYVEKSMNLPPGAVPLEMVKIPAGSFVMGSPASEVGRNDDEDPKRWVTVPAFLMGRFEVTQAQYEAVMGTNPSHFNGINLPVEHINWYEAQEFIDRLNEMTGKNYRLPTEAEWEYAARARTESPFSYGETINSRLANFNEASDLNSNEVQESGRPTQEVDSLYPNPWGLYHVHGNVWEWVEDYWQNNYADAPTDGGAQLTGNSQGYKVLRGGSSESNIRQIRSASRLAVNPDGSFYDAGFRLVLTLE